MIPWSPDCGSLPEVSSVASITTSRHYSSVKWMQSLTTGHGPSQIQHTQSQYKTETMILANAAMMPHKATNCCCYLSEYRSVTWIWCVRYIWLHEAELLGNHGLCISLLSFTLFSWPCPLYEGFWWAVQEYQFGKQIFLQV